MDISQSYPPFLGSEIGNPEPKKSRFHILPVPYEKSVSYGEGTAAGPQAILAASWQLELFDGVGIPAETGIHTCDHLTCTGSHAEDLSQIETWVARTMGAGHTPILIGGEHTVSVGAFRALKKQGAAVGIVQFDAHADLRTIYEDDPLSHACTMHRALDLGFEIFQIGVRSLSLAEHELREEKRIRHLDAAQIAAGGVPAVILPDDFPRQIYITMDVDGLDPSVIPATGTPEPGGLGWYAIHDALAAVIRDRHVVGFDLVELAPAPGLHHADFAAAKLLYNTMGLIQRLSTSTPG